MNVDLFDFDLPKEYIALHPAEPRETARLLCVPSLHDLQIKDLPSLLQPGDVMVFNNTRVIPARLQGMRGSAQIEATLCENIGTDRWYSFIRNARRLRIGDEIKFSPTFSACVLGKTESGQIELRFNKEGADLMAALNQFGQMPLPPYIRRSDTEENLAERDRLAYQTVYAKHDGAVAAPTAGLHFTPSLLGALERMGIEQTYVTLHVGAGTFLPVKVDQTHDHVMHSEWGELDGATCDTLNQARAAGRRIIAVGTTSLRVLETAVTAEGEFRPFRAKTNIFITPGYQFKAVDALMTNFHLPRSTLFMLVCAFCGLEIMQAAYAHARAERYRFYSYGDACFLTRQDYRL